MAALRSQPKSTLEECDAPFLSAIHVACPPRLIPDTIHSLITRSSFGKRYHGRKSTSDDTSCAVPAVGNNREG